MINQDRRACVADFGLSTITGARTGSTAKDSDTATLSSFLSNDTLMSFTPGGTTRWMSPELLDPERFGVPESESDRQTRQSDCYALGMVIYEVGSSVDKAVDRFNRDTGIMRTQPIPRHYAGRSGHGGSRRGGSTEETRECRTPWIH